jgi:hypothetical protein
MCDDLDAIMAELAAKGVEFIGGVSERSYGRVTTIKLPSGGPLGLYQPKHPIALNRESAASS